ncbi:MAG: M48 family metallopeptidase [Chitinophagales bacterium]
MFLTVWFGFSSIDYVKHFHLNGLSKRTEKKIGKVIMDGIKKSNKEIETDSVVQVMDEIKTCLCTGNAIDPDEIHLHLIESDDVNAFALPGNHIVVYTGLINQCDSVTELCGVLSHEIAHLQLNHVMKRLINEIGIGVLATIATNGNSQVVSQIIKTLSSTAFERKQESEADAKGVEFLKHARINPRGFSDFMFKIADSKPGTPSRLAWLSTHPDSKERAETILSLIDTTHTSYKPVMSNASWQTLKNAADDK